MPLGDLLFRETRTRRELKRDDRSAEFALDALRR
jgi:hypothetical protein